MFGTQTSSDSYQCLPDCHQLISGTIGLQWEQVHFFHWKKIRPLACRSKPSKNIVKCISKVLSVKKPTTPDYAQGYLKA